MTTASEAHFEHLFRADPDPWGYDTRWYEKRKRALLLAALPKAHYRLGVEPACGNGALTAELAMRCDELLASDASAEAVRLAKNRLSKALNVRVTAASLPGSWPPGQRSCDLIVFSEIGYYLDIAALGQCVAHIDRLLADDGDLVACHWRRDAPDRLQSTERVHETLDGISGLRMMARHLENDFILQVWSRDKRTIHDREAAR